MYILSIYPGHNSTVCILKNGKVVLNLELERFTRVKHDYGYNEAFVRWCLDFCGITILDINVVTINRGFHDSVLPHLRPATRLRPCGVPETHDQHQAKFTASILGRSGIPAFAINHHLAHLASAYYTSPYPESSLLAIDGGGDLGQNTAVGSAKGNKIVKFSAYNDFNIAGIWSQITFNNYRMPRCHEWDPGSGAGKIMALASYGKPSSELIARFVKQINTPMKGDFTDKASTWAFDDDVKLADTTQQLPKDVAACLQLVTEDIITQHFNMAQSSTMCYSGGVALNCIANTKALRVSKLERLHVPPCPNDTGLALGMALYAWHHIGDKPKTNEYFSPYTGPEHGYELSIADEFEIDTATPESIAALLADDEIICHYRGKSECGPRALGNRSILASPNKKDVKEIINQKIKKREWYRPYAPIVLDTHADEVFESYNEWSPYMTTGAKVREDWRDRLKGITHVDDTTRPQILKQEHNPWMYEIITEFYKKTGIPLILNTSFNMQEPIVETPSQALATFKRFHQIKHLILNDKILSKHETSSK